MSNYGGTDLARSFRVVRDNTLQIAQELPEEQYGFKASPDTRSIAQLLTHIALGPTFQLHVHTNKIDDLKKVNFPELVKKMGAEEAKPRTKAEIIAFLKAEGDRYASFVEGLTDEFLRERVTMPPGADPATKSRFEMLLSPKEHEMHHRGQLMLLERMVGVVPHLTRRAQERAAAAAAHARP